MEERRRRIRNLVQYLKTKRSVTIKEVTGYFAMNFGLTKRTALEYLNLLNDAGFIRIERKKPFSMSRVFFVKEEF
jgi:predicted DNA-binding transcriptional regulator YafY